MFVNITKLFFGCQESTDSSRPRELVLGTRKFCGCDGRSEDKVCNGEGGRLIRCCDRRLLCRYDQRR